MVQLPYVCRYCSLPTCLLGVCAIYFLAYIYSNPSHKIINMSLVVNILQTAAVFSTNDSSDFIRKSQWGEPIGATLELLKICWWSWNTSVAPGVLRDFWRIECIIMQYAKIIVNEYTYIYIYTVRIKHNFNQITLINNLNSIQLHSWQVCQWENALNICQIRQQKRHVHLPSSGTTPKACQKLISKSIPLPRDHCYITLYYNIVLYHTSFWYINYGGFEILTNHIINW